jgi:hypothetical protein
MAIQVPSYAHKISWAEQHLLKLEQLVTDFERAQSYELAHTTEGKRRQDVYRLRFTRQPDYRIALIAGDFLERFFLSW